MFKVHNTICRIDVDQRHDVKISLVRCSTSEARVVDDDLWDLIEVYAPTVGEFLTGFAALPPSAFGDSADVADAIVAGAGMAEPPLPLAVGPTRSTASGPRSNPGWPSWRKSAQRGRLAQQH
jgi:hypothetical protein